MLVDGGCVQHAVLVDGGCVPHAVLVDGGCILAFIVSSWYWSVHYNKDRPITGHTYV